MKNKTIIEFGLRMMSRIMLISEAVIENILCIILHIILTLAQQLLNAIRTVAPHDPPDLVNRIFICSTVFRLISVK